MNRGRGPRCGEVAGWHRGTRPRCGDILARAIRGEPSNIDLAPLSFARFGRH
jgi:hypothetical protein